MRDSTVYEDNPMIAQKRTEKAAVPQSPEQSKAVVGGTKGSDDRLKIVNRMVACGLAIALLWSTSLTMSGI